MLQDNVQTNTSIRDVSSQPGTSATENNNPANPERVGSLRGDPISMLEKRDTLGANINLETVYQHMMIIRRSIINLDTMTRRKEIQPQQLKMAIILSTAGLLDKIRSVTEFLEVTNL